LNSRSYSCLPGRGKASPAGQTDTAGSAPPALRAWERLGLESDMNNLLVMRSAQDNATNRETALA
jgi:hypothetical protein